MRGLLLLALAAAVPGVNCIANLGGHPCTTLYAYGVSAGVTNAATGAEGESNARRTAALAAEALGCAPDDVLVASTGVIGHQLPMDRMEDGLGRAIATLSPRESSFREASPTRSARCSTIRSHAGRSPSTSPTRSA